MRGNENRQEAVVVLDSPEDRVTAVHRLRAIRRLADTALREPGPSSRNPTPRLLSPPARPGANFGAHSSPDCRLFPPCTGSASVCRLLRPKSSLAGLLSHASAYRGRSSASIGNDPLDSTRLSMVCTGRRGYRWSLEHWRQVSGPATARPVRCRGP